MAFCPYGFWPLERSDDDPVVSECIDDERFIRGIPNVQAASLQIQRAAERLHIAQSALSLLRDYLHRALPRISLVA
jgi:hypothetical protein